MLQPLPFPLPRGITFGATHGRSYGTEDGIGPETFQAACEHAAFIVRGKVEEWHDPLEQGWRMSYREATLVYDFGRKRVRVLCYAPVISFTRAETSRDPQKISFVDCPEIEAAIGEKLDGLILRAADAARQPAPPLTDQLEEQEIRNINYHKPQRIGELFFNDWA